MGLLSLYHLASGIGCPVILHCRQTRCPDWTLKSRSGWENRGDVISPMEASLNSLNAAKIHKLPHIHIQKCMVFSFNVNIMETLLILKSLTFNMQFTETFSLAVDIVGNDSVGSGILQIGLPDTQCAAVTFKQQLDVLGLLNRLVVLVPDDLWFGVTHQDAIQTHSWSLHGLFGWG